MLRYILIALLLFGHSTPLYAEWTTTEKVTEVVVVTSLLVDMAQTLDIKNHEGLYETNPILGKHPSDKKVVSYFLTCILGHLLIADSLGNKKVYWQHFILIPEIYIIGHNYELGLSVKF